MRRSLVLSLIAGLGLFAGCQAGSGPTIKASSNPWFAAASSGNQADLDSALKSSAKVNDHEGHDRYTPLHTAAIAGNAEAVKFILAHGGQVDALDEDGRTALMMALY